MKESYSGGGLSWKALPLLYSPLHLGFRGLGGGGFAATGEPRAAGPAKPATAQAEHPLQGNTLRSHSQSCTDLRVAAFTIKELRLPAVAAQSKSTMPDKDTVKIYVVFYST